MTPEAILDHDGIEQPIIEWALDYGITPAIIIGRLERSMSVADAVTTPMQTCFRGQRLPIYSEEQRNVRRPFGRNIAPKQVRKGAALAPPSLSCPDKKSSAGED